MAPAFSLTDYDEKSEPSFVGTPMTHEDAHKLAEAIAESPTGNREIYFTDLKTGVRKHHNTKSGTI